MTGGASLSTACTTAVVLRFNPAHQQQHPVRASIDLALQTWQGAVAPSTTVPIGGQGKRAWKEPCCVKIAADLLETGTDNLAQAVMRVQTTSGAWLRTCIISTYKTF